MTAQFMRWLVGFSVVVLIICVIEIVALVLCEGFLASQIGFRLRLSNYSHVAKNCFFWKCNVVYNAGSGEPVYTLMVFVPANSGFMCSQFCVMVSSPDALGSDDAGLRGFVCENSWWLLG